MRFAKAHGYGNDFILVEAGRVPADSAPWARLVCDRHLGVGGDGILAYEAVPGGVHMRLINSDGTDAEISANGVRCLAAYAFARGIARAEHIVDATGPRSVAVESLSDRRFRVKTDLGAPALDSHSIPIALEPPRDRVVDLPVDVNGRPLRITATSFANPHCTIFVDAPLDDATLASLGGAVEHHTLFPRRTNVEFATVLSRAKLRVRFWERGAGITMASGTGSAAAFVAASLNGLVDRRVDVVCDGGVIACEWLEGGSVVQTGEVELVCEGELLVER